MSESLVIARKFRPKLFDEVVGQEAITRTLRNSIISNRLHHAYLFTGARGVGKTTTARILAKCLNCATGVTAEPCGVCESCRDIAASRSIDVQEIDAASHTGIDNVRDVIIGSVQIAPARDRYKIFIIDEVHMLSTQAFNGLLKTLEEPPPHVVFIMATTELHKVPETILSRCQIFEFRTISIKRIFEQLRMIANDIGIEISDSALLAIARAGEGSMRDAESALDQVISFAGNVITDEDVSSALGLVDLETLNTIMRAIADQDARRVLSIVEEIVSRGYDLRNLCRELMVHIRALLVVKISGFDQELLQMPEGEGEPLARLADAFSEQDLLRFFSILTKTEQDIRVSSQPRFQLEMGLMKLLHAGRLYMLEEALERIQEASSRLNGGGAGQTGSLPPSRTPQTGTPSTGGPRRGPGSLRTSQPESTQQSGSKPATDETASSETAPVAAQDLSPPPALPVEPSPGDEPPPSDDILSPPAQVAQEREAAPFDGVALIKKALEERRKMLLLSVLDQAESIELDGNYLCISFPPEKSMFKAQVESRDNRKLLEEVCRAALGRPFTLSVSVGGKVKPVAPTPIEKPPEMIKSKPKAENHPLVRAIVDRFHGEVVEVIDPDHRT